MKKITDRLLAGGGVKGDADQLKTVADNIAGRTICAFGEACSWPTQSFLAKFKADFEARATKPLPPAMPPEILPDQLIANLEISTIHGPHSEGTHDVIALSGSTSSKKELTYQDEH
jgi:hypothetical protein